MLDEATLSTQQHRRRIAMTPEEIDEFLSGERTCRLASVTPSGAPHVSALWFAWDGASMWFYSIVNSERWADIARDPRAAVLSQAGTHSSSGDTSALIFPLSRVRERVGVRARRCARLSLRHRRRNRRR